MILSARFLRNPSILGELPENRLTFAGMAIKDGLAKKIKRQSSLDYKPVFSL